MTKLKNSNPTRTQNSNSDKTLFLTKKKNIYFGKNKLKPQQPMRCTLGSLLQSRNVFRQMYETNLILGIPWTNVTFFRDLKNDNYVKNQANTYCSNNFKTTPYCMLQKYFNIILFYYIYIGWMGIHGVVSFGHRPRLRGHVWPIYLAVLLSF